MHLAEALGHTQCSINVRDDDGGNNNIYFFNQSLPTSLAHLPLLVTFILYSSHAKL